jgi:hypothetical protein
MFNPLPAIAKLLYTPFKTIILETWQAAWNSAAAEIQAKLAAETDLGPARLVLAQLAAGQVAQPAAAIAAETTEIAETPRKRK